MPEFSTRSLAVVAVLRLHAILPISVGDDGTGRRAFYFARTPLLIALVDAYHADDLTVTARAYASAMHDVRREYIGAR